MAGSDAGARGASSKSADGVLAAPRVARKAVRRPGRARIGNFARGFGSLLDLWPAVKYEEVYPSCKAEDVYRRSAERMAAAFRTAIGEVHLEQEAQKAAPAVENTPGADDPGADDRQRARARRK